MTIKQIAAQLAQEIPTYTFKTVAPTSIAVSDQGRQVGILSIGDPAARVTPINIERIGPLNLLPADAVTEISARVAKLLQAQAGTK